MRLSRMGLWAVPGVVALLLLLTGVYQGRLYLLGRHQLQAGQQALDERDFARASELFYDCLTYWPDDPTATLLLAQALRRNGDSGAALKILRDSEQRGAATTTLALERELLEVQNGDFLTAEPLLNRCRKRPEATESVLGLEALLKGGMKLLPPAFEPAGASPQHAKLIELLDEATELWLTLPQVPADRALGLICRGELRLLKGDFPGASADFHQAVEVAPEHFEARLRLAMLTLRDSPEKGLTHLRTLYQRDPTHTTARYCLATALRAAGEFQEAREVLDRALRESSPDLGCLVERGLLALDMGEFQDAERRLRQAVGLAPGLARAHQGLSRSLQALGKKEEAKRHWDEFRRLEPEHGSASNP